MKNLFVIKRFYLLMLFVVIGFSQMYGFNDTFYSRLTGEAAPTTGHGKVYIDEQEGSNTQQSEAQSAPTHSYVIKAVPSNGDYIFESWTAGSGVTISNATSEQTNASIVASSTNDKSPTTGTVTANFVQGNRFYARVLTTVYPAQTGSVIGEISTKNILTKESSADISFTLTATPAADYAFLGWSTSQSEANIFATEATETFTITATSKTEVSPTTEMYYALFEKTVATPVITIDASTSSATITCTTADATIYYTLDGSDPTISSTEYSGTIQDVNEGVVIKAFAVKNGYKNSSIAVKSFTISAPTGISGGVVTLNDLEDHNWSYYSDAECPIHSWNPADVKITYYGNGTATVTTTNDDNPTPTSFTADATGVKVGIDADANTFVYYKTLERTDGSTAATPSSVTGRCAYTTIPNPFSVRPTYGSEDTRWRGFYKWRVKRVSGGTIHSASTGGVTYAQGSTIDSEEEIYFAPNAEYGMEVEFEALWARAYVVTSNTTSGLKSTVSYERNFVYLSSNTQLQNAALSCPVTYTTLDPSTGNGTKRTITIRDGFTCNANTKFENLTFAQYNNTAQTLTANGHDLIVGRGCSGTVGTVRGMNGGSSDAVDYTIRLESGTYSVFALIDNSAYTYQNTISTKAVFGCDYDRAKGDNSLLSVSPSNTIYGGNASHTFSNATNRNNLTYDWLIKSGTVQKDYNAGDGAAERSLYMGNPISGEDGVRYCGKRRLTMEGGEVLSIAGGVNAYGNPDTYRVNDGGWSVMIRLKGGLVRGAIYGAAAYAGASGDRLFIFTGGTIGGWVAGGANGTRSTGGELYGSTSLYMGGKTVIGSESGGTHVGGTSSYGTNGADGGNVFGAGCGILPANGNYQTGTVGRVNNSIVAVADEATIWRDVYGGGNYGWVRDNGTTGIYILGGMVNGSVYGGSNNQQGQEVVITMKGGVIKGNTIGDATKTGGLYGGSYSWGTINNNVTMQINGGQVGTSSQPANIHGGGYGQSTRVSGNVEVTLGTEGQATGGVTVYGDVYGGSALGYVNGTAATSTYHTHVTMNKGTIYGSLYGGALGNASTPANVYGPVEVKVRGGSVKATSVAGSGGVYGANNINGAPQRSVTVDIYGTDPAPAEGEYALYAVYGGGNQADYLYGNGYPTVTVHGCDNSIEYVYGGGNAAAVKSTNVTIWGGNVIGNVFGGGHGYKEPSPDGVGADVNGDVSVTIYGGTIGKVFGGSNTLGNITGGINLTINKEGECSMHIDEVYGGGNEAAGNAGIINIGCTGGEDEGIGDVYGGANAADINSDITLNITGGNINNVFGGNNTSGNILGEITVNVENTGACGLNVNNVYGAGNKAAYGSDGDRKGNFPQVNIKSGTVNENVYGGGLGPTAVVYGNPQVTMTQESMIATTVGNVFGGGNAAEVEGNTNVNITGGNVLHNVYGGGNQANVTGQTNVVIGK